MRALTPRRVALIAAAAGIVAFLPALGNGWALDDVGVIQRNPAVHALGDALGHFFQPYWPRAGETTAGLWRPAVILTYAADWAAGGGRPWVLHLGNVLWHAVATGLLVLVAAAWLSGVPLVVAALVFALHPVHVEAVANVVGRAELLAAVCVLGALLAARRHRAATGAARRSWGAAAVALVALGLLVKEHAVVALPMLALDGWLTRGRHRADAALYLALGAIVLAWLHLWRAVAGGFVLETVAAPFRDLGITARWALMAPVLLDVLRLLVWPFDLAADYNPQLIDPATALSLPGVLGVASVLALAVLGLRTVRRAPAVAFGLLGAGLAWGPTSNLVVPSGIVLAERTLYLPSIAVALVAGWIATVVPRLSPARRRLVTGAAVLLGVAWIARVESRIPFWHDTRTVVVEDYLAHPENYRAHARVGSVFELTGDTTRALREFLLAAEIWPGDYVLTLQTARAARALGQTRVAIAEARRGWAMAPQDPVLAERLAATLAWAGQYEEALGVAAAGIARNPGVPLLEERYLAILEAQGAPAWWRALVEARLAWLTARPGAAGATLARAAGRLVANPPRAACRDLTQAALLARNLLLETAATLNDAAFTACSVD